MTNNPAEQPYLHSSCKVKHLACGLGGIITGIVSMALLFSGTRSYQKVHQEQTAPGCVPLSDLEIRSLRLNREEYRNQQTYPQFTITDPVTREPIHYILRFDTNNHPVLSRYEITPGKKETTPAVIIPRKTEITPAEIRYLE